MVREKKPIISSPFRNGAERRSNDARLTPYEKR
jgi:hypothetical protein